jgi:hypothetical protein
LAYLEKAKTIPEYNYDNTVVFDEDARELDPEDTDYEIIRVFKYRLY